MRENPGGVQSVLFIAMETRILTMGNMNLSYENQKHLTDEYYQRNQGTPLRAQF